MSVRVKPRNVVSQHVPQRLLRDATQDEQLQWPGVLQEAVPDMEYTASGTDPSDGKGNFWLNYGVLASAH